jgi:release factor glutamine methyltransferase
MVLRGSAAITLKATTRRAALKEAVALMKAAALDTPVLDARLIVQHALGVGWETLFLQDDQTLGDDERARLEHELTRRAACEPVSRIVGRRHFWTLDLAVSPDTLDPRADTETLIEAALAAFPDRTLPLRVLDFGTGTGALLLAILAEYKAATGLGIDRSPGAIAVATHNAADHQLGGRAEFRLGDWGQGIAGAFDLILSNPPYIERGALAGLPRDVRDYDPPLALDGGEDGLDAYRALCPDIAALLALDGMAILEVGQGQADAVVSIAGQSGLLPAGRRSDLGGIARALSFRREAGR